MKSTEEVSSELNAVNLAWVFDTPQIYSDGVYTWLLYYESEKNVHSAPNLIILMKGKSELILDSIFHQKSIIFVVSWGISSVG